MKVLITGGSGYIGSALAEDLAKDGHEAIVLSRNPDRVVNLPPGVRTVKWDGRTAQGWGELADGAEAIVNLAGENLSAGRWTKRRKQQIIDSRVNAGNAVLQAIQQSTKKPLALIQSSAVGYYGPSGDELLTEAVSPATDFLANVCQTWEESTRPTEALGVRRVVVRSGVVLGNESVAYKRMLLPFKLFVGGPLGSGKQWLSWVHEKDEIRALRFLIENPEASGVYNIAAQPLTNRQFAKAMGKVLRRPSFIPVPAIAIRLLFGEMSTVVLDGQRVSAERLQGLGFRFSFPVIEMALEEILHSKD